MSIETNNNMHSSLENNGLPTPVSSSVISSGGQYRTAGQAMQPPILSPTSVSRPPVYMQVNPGQPMTPAPQGIPVSQPVLAPQMTAPAAQPVLAPQMAAPATQPVLAPTAETPASQDVSTPVLNPMQQSMPSYTPVLTPGSVTGSSASPVLTPGSVTGSSASPVLTPGSVTGSSASPVLTPASASSPVLAPVSTAPAFTSSAAVPAQSAASDTKQAKKAKKEKKSRKDATAKNVTMSRKRIAAVAVAFLVLGAGLSTCGALALGLRWADQVKSEAVSAAKKTAQKNSGSSSDSSKKQTTVVEGNREYAVINTSTIDTNELHTASEIYAANVNSTVGIATSVQYNYYGYDTTAAVAGSGFILTADGYIVTNYHVIEDGSDIKVTTFDNKTYDAEVVGYDAKNDLAVLKIDAEGLTPVILGSSDNLNVGDDVIAIGNPLGELTFSLTKGCVSALNRNVTLNDNLQMNLIQTDCAINSGNSGGALFNMYGEVIGITNAKYSNNGDAEASIESIGFAIPIDSVRNNINSIIEKGYAENPYIGVYAETVTDSNGYNADGGIGISDIVPGSPAERAGIKPGDVIVKINSSDVTDVSDLKKYINDVGVGGELELTIHRNGQIVEITVEVGDDQSS